MNRIPGLDGLRGAAIALVYAGHAAGVGGVPMNKRVQVFGEIGVNLFFVISGFLITSLLMKERDKTGDISLKQFYIRRTWRIFPAFYLYFGVMLILAAVGAMSLGRKDAVYGGTYMMDLHAQDQWNVGHLWSLGVEEKFYLVWPCILVFAGVQRGLYFVVASIFVGPALRLATFAYEPAWRDMEDRAFPFVFDALAVGCVLAMMRGWFEKQRHYMAFLKSPAFWIVPICAFLAQNHDAHFDIGVKPTIIALAAALTIHRLCLVAPQNLATRILEMKPFVWVGTLSYSLYLWQQPFFPRESDHWSAQFPVNVLCAVACACASYYLVERPILKWRGRLRTT